MSRDRHQTAGHRKASENRDQWSPADQLPWSSFLPSGCRESAEEEWENAGEVFETSDGVYHVPNRIPDVLRYKRWWRARAREESGS